MKRSPSLIALAVAFAGGTALAVHDEDPKVLDVQPIYQGPGFVPGSFRGGLALGSGSQTPPVNFERSGVRLLSWLTLPELGFGSGNDCWGYVSPSGREYALMGTGQGTAFVEVTQPTDPQVLAVIPGPVSLWRDIKVYQDHAYAVSEGGDGIQVFDLSNIDAGQVTHVNTVMSGGTTATHNVAIDEDSGFLYRCGGGGNGLRIYSLANPSNPTYVGSWGSRYVHDAQIVTYTSGPYAGRQIAFVCSGFGNGGTQTRFEVLDVTNKGNIWTRSEVHYSDRAYSHQVWVDAERHYAYLNDELDEGGTIDTRTIIFDISNLDSTSEVGTFTNGNPAIGHNLYMRGDLIFEANYRSGLRVFDATNRTSPVETAFFDTYPVGDRPQFNGMWSCYPFFPSGTVLGSDRERGLFVMWVGATPIDIAMPGGVPETIAPSGQSLLVEITEQTAGELVAGTPTLHYDSGSGVVSVPLAHLGGTQYHADLPATACGTELRWYVSAESSNGIEWRFPEGAPMASAVTISALSQNVLFHDDFENDLGWTLDVANDTATEGQWQRTDPVGTAGAPPDDFSEIGTQAYVTGRLKDVDDGFTSLLSPVFDLTGADDPYLDFQSWFCCTESNLGSSDTFRVFLSSDSGQNWTQVLRVSQNDGEENSGWFHHSIRLADWVQISNGVQFKFEARDRGGPNNVEAALDEVRVLDRPCTVCTATNFCVTTPNSVGAGALIGLSGSTSVSAADLVLEVADAVPGQFGVFYYGPEQTQAPFGDGQRCVAPGSVGLFRFSPAVQVDANGDAALAVDYQSQPAGSGPGALTVGSSWNFQFWYRDPSGGAAGFNLSDGIELVFCP